MGFAGFRAGAGPKEGLDGFRAGGVEQKNKQVLVLSRLTVENQARISESMFRRCSLVSYIICLFPVFYNIMQCG